LGSYENQNENGLENKEEKNRQKNLTYSTTIESLQLVVQQRGGNRKSCKAAQS